MTKANVKESGITPLMGRAKKKKTTYTIAAGELAQVVERSLSMCVREEITKGESIEAKVKGIITFYSLSTTVWISR